jgi:hypothetical protein
VPDLAHPQVSAPPAPFTLYLDYLRAHHGTVIALRELERLVPKKE